MICKQNIKRTNRTLILIQNVFVLRAFCFHYNKNSTTEEK
jgi:hypothetical protein